jgi:hypothetical protein
MCNSRKRVLSWKVMCRTTGKSRKGVASIIQVVES